MSFITFSLYFLGSMLIWKGIQVVCYIIYKKYVNFKFQKAIKDGKIKVVTMDDIFEDKTDDGIWH